MQTMINKTKLLKILLFVILFSTSLFTCFYKVDSQPLKRWDEYTNFRVVKETLESSNPLILKYGGTEFLEKPPLWYWMTIAITNTFGINTTTLRIVSAFSGFLVILLTFYLGWKMFSFKSGIISSFVLLGTRHLFIDSPTIFSTHTFRSADLDALQLVFIMLSSLSLWKFTEKNKYNWLILAGIFTGLGFLTKGPFSLIPVISFFIYLMIQIPYKKIAFKKALFTISLFTITYLLIILPWHLLMYSKFRGEFLDNYLGYHILKRSFTAIEQHNESVFFYMKLLLDPNFFFSGIIYILAVINIIISKGKKILTNFPLFHCLTVSLLTITLITLIQTKLSWYLFSFYPFGALTIGIIFTIRYNTKYSALLKCFSIALKTTIFILLSLQTFITIFYIAKI
jgi:4-amino-4-deoxy-L-arabinose transferase-like glycosyltransferase